MILPALVHTLFAVTAAAPAHAKSFQNSYVSFEVPEDWSCVQEGVAWTCTPVKLPESKQAVIVVAAKVAGPEDTIPNFVTYLQQPRRITTKVGTPMPSKVMYSQQRTLAGGTWVQAQHESSEIQDYYTLYLATVKEQLAILVSFSAEKNNYGKFNPIFDKALKTLKITADAMVLFPKGRKVTKSELVGIQMPGADPNGEMILNVPALAKSGRRGQFVSIAAGALAVLALAFLLWRRRRKPKSSSPATKRSSRGRSSRK